MEAKSESDGLAGFALRTLNARSWDSLRSHHLCGGNLLSQATAYRHAEQTQHNSLLQISQSFCVLEHGILRGFSTRSRKALQKLQPDRHAFGWRRSHPEEFRADAAPGGEVAADPDHRRAGETDLLPCLCRRKARCAEEPSGGCPPVVL